MKIPPRTLCFLLVAGTACASSGTPRGGAGDAALAFGVPQGGAATYVQADTTLVSLDAGGQTIDIDQTSRATLDMRFVAVSEGVQVTATWTELDAAASNPMTGTERATAADIEGPVVFTVGPTGRATIVSHPTVSTTGAQLVDVPTWAATFFPRLPAATVAPGFAWTDTVAARSERPEGVILSRSVVDYTVRGDTTVAGSTLLKVTFTSRDERSADISQQGMAMNQTLSGAGRGWFLWDTARGRLHSQMQSGAYTGSMQVDAAPFPLGLAVEARSHVRLADGS